MRGRTSRGIVGRGSVLVYCGMALFACRVVAAEERQLEFRVVAPDSLGVEFPYIRLDIRALGLNAGPQVRAQYTIERQRTPSDPQSWPDCRDRMERRLRRAAYFVDVIPVEAGLLVTFPSVGVDRIKTKSGDSKFAMTLPLAAGSADPAMECGWVVIERARLVWLADFSAGDVYLNLPTHPEETLRFPLLLIAQP